MDGPVRRDSSVCMLCEMKVLLVVVVALALVPSAMAKPDPAITALKKQVAALTLQVKALRAQQTQTRNLTVCYFALSRDTFQVVYKALSTFSEMITGQRIPAWDSIPRFDDQGACAAVGLARP